MPVAVAQSLEERSDDEFQLARNLFRDAGDYATSAQLFSEFIRNYPRHRHLSEARLILARSYALSDRCQQAIPAYEQFYSEHPDHISIAEARRERASCWETLGEFTRAAQAHEEIQHLYPGSEYAARALLEAAANYTKAVDWPSALGAYERLLEEYGHNLLASRARFNMAQIAFASGQVARAQRLLDEITSTGGNAAAMQDALLFSGRIQLFLDNPTTAEQAFQVLRQRYPKAAHSDSALLDLGNYHLSKGQYNVALEIFDSARKQPADDSLNIRAEVSAADALQLGGHHLRALERYHNLLGKRSLGPPLRAAAQLGVAVSYGYTGHFAESVALFLGLVQQSPTDQTAALRFRAIRELAGLYRRQGDLTRSATWFQHYLKEVQDRGPAEDAGTLSQVRLHLAQVLDAAGYDKEAIEQFKQLLRSDPPVAPRAQLGLARTYENAGQPALALVEYQTFIERFPTNSLAAEARRRAKYLSEFTVLDPDGLDAFMKQAWLDELSGTSRQTIRFRVAQALRDYRDYANAVRQLETYVAAYFGDATASEAHYYLADCLLLLARQRNLEGKITASDSLRQLANQELRILAAEGTGRWQLQAQLRLLEADLEGIDAVERAHLLQERMSEFRQLSDVDTNVHAAAELILADAMFAAATQSQQWQGVSEAYRHVLNQAQAGGKHIEQARFGIAVSMARNGQTAAAVDSLEVLLGDLAGGALVPHVLFELGRALLSVGDVGAGAARFQELLLAFPSFPERLKVQMALASARYKLGHYTESIQLLRQLQQTDLEGELGQRVRRQLALAYESQGEAQPALDLYEQLLDFDAKGARADSARLARARLLRTLGRIDEAIAQFEKIASMDSSRLANAAAREAGDLHFTGAQYTAALLAYEQAAPAKDIDVEGLRAVSLYRLGQTQGAERATNAVRKKLKTDDPWRSILAIEEGRHLLHSHRYDNALKVFRYASKQPARARKTQLPDKGLRQIAEYPVAAAKYFVATALWEQNLRETTEERAARALEAQVQFAREHGESPFGASVHLRLGHYYRGVLNQLLPAAGAFRRVVEGNGSPEQKQEGFWLLLQCYKNLFEWDEAYRIARQLLLEYPDHPQVNAVHLEIGYILKERGQYSQAIEYLENVLEWAQGDVAAQARYYIGESFQKMGRYREAIERYYRVSFHGLRVYTGWINSADFKRAQCHEELGEFTQAASIYNRIIQREGSESEYGIIAGKGLARVDRSLTNDRAKKKVD